MCRGLIISPFMVEVSSLSLSVTLSEKTRVDDLERQRGREREIEREGEKNHPLRKKRKRKKCAWSAVNYSWRKQSAFPEGFGQYDAVISAYLNSLTTAIKTKIQSATSFLLKSCLWALYNKNLKELDTVGSDCVTPSKLTRLKTSLRTINNIHSNT